MSGMISSNPLPAPRSVPEWLISAATWWLSNTIIVAAKFGNWLGETSARSRKWLDAIGTRSRKWLLGHPWLVFFTILTGAFSLLGHLEWLKEGKANWQWYLWVLVGPAIPWLAWLVARLRHWRFQKPQLHISIPRRFAIGALVLAGLWILCQFIYWPTFLLADTHYWLKLERAFWPVMLWPIGVAMIWAIVEAQLRLDWIGKTAEQNWKKIPRERTAGKIFWLVFTGFQLTALAIIERYAVSYGLKIANLTHEWFGWHRQWPWLAVAIIIGAIGTSLGFFLGHVILLVVKEIVQTIFPPRHPWRQELSGMEITVERVEYPLNRLVPLLALFTKWKVQDPSGEKKLSIWSLTWWQLLPRTGIDLFVGYKKNPQTGQISLVDPTWEIRIRREGPWWLGFIGPGGMAPNIRDQEKSLGNIPGFGGELLHSYVGRLTDATAGHPDSVTWFTASYARATFIREEPSGEKERLRGMDACQEWWKKVVGKAKGADAQETSLRNQLARKQYFGA